MVVLVKYIILKKIKIRVQSSFKKLVRGLTGLQANKRFTKVISSFQVKLSQEPERSSVNEI